MEKKVIVSGHGKNHEVQKNKQRDVGICMILR